MNIKINNLTKEFNKNTIIDIKDFTFENNHIYGLYGRNGSGKTVLLKLLCGYYIPTTGEVLFNNINYNKLNRFPENTRAFIGAPCFYDDLNAFDNLEILAKIENKITNDDINHALDIVNLNEGAKIFKNFSLGMKQKLGIAQALMENPEVIFLDEPFNGVERESVDKICKYLKDQKNKIIIISSHIKDDLVDLCDTFITMDNGTIIEVATNDK